MTNREGGREWGSDGGDHNRWRKATFMKLLRRFMSRQQSNRKERRKNKKKNNRTPTKQCAW